MVGVIAPNRIEIVVLTRNAQTFLRIDCARVWAGFSAKEDVFKLHHAGVGEEQGAVSTRDQ